MQEERREWLNKVRCRCGDRACIPIAKARGISHVFDNGTTTIGDITWITLDSTTGNPNGSSGDVYYWIDAFPTYSILTLSSSRDCQTFYYNKLAPSPLPYDQITCNDLMGWSYQYNAQNINIQVNDILF
jgi:hypothetical protein